MSNNSWREVAHEEFMAVKRAARLAHEAKVREIRVDLETLEEELLGWRESDEKFDVLVQLVDKVRTNLALVLKLYPQ